MPDILIVEDNLMIADMLQEALEQKGFRICAVARTVDCAVQAAARHKPDHAIIDLHLADGGLGTDVAASLRGFGGIGILFSTGNDEGGIERSLADAVMIKPYRLADVATGLRIIDEIARSGKTDLPFPRKFRLLMPTDTFIEDQPVVTELQ